jgi:hypothetical protein
MMGCEKINNLIPQSGTKGQRVARKNRPFFFAPGGALSRLAGWNAFALPGIIS